MILLFLPSMGVVTKIFVRTSIPVVINKGSRSPIRALFLYIIVKLWFSSEILPIVRINTLISLMIGFIVGAPDSLKMKHIEIRIFLESVYQFHWYFTLWVGERAKLSIFTITSSFNIRCTEFSFVLIRMIEFFNPVMWFLAVISIRTFFSFYSKATHLWLIWSQRSPLIFLLIVIKWASL